MSRMGVNALFAALGVKGAKAIETSAVARGKAKAGLEELAKLKAEGDARNAAADAAALAKEVQAGQALLVELLRAEAGRGAALGPRLPAGTPVTLPEPATLAPATRETVRLWD